MIKLTKKQTEQYSYLKSFFNISKSEYLDYYKQIRKVNKKTGSKQFKQGAINIPHYSYEVHRITSRRSFLERRRKLRKVLQRDFKVQSNKQYRENARRNLRRILGYKNASEIIAKLDSLGDEDIIQFWKENKDIQSVGYDSDQRLFDFIDLTTESMKSRLDEFI